MSTGRVRWGEQAAAFRRLGVKVVLWFLVLNIGFAILDPIRALGRLSLYNRLFPGRERLPYAEAPRLAYSLTTTQVEGMFASHIVLAPADDERTLRLFLLGDSSVWGYGQRHDQTLAAAFNALDLRLPDGRKVRAYNLGYPGLSATKDLLLLSRSLDADPDAIVWLITLESLLVDQQLRSPLLRSNPVQTTSLTAAWDLPLDLDGALQPEATFLQRTVVGRRRELADLFRLQLYGFLWAATGVDSAPGALGAGSFPPAPSGLRYHEIPPGELSSEKLALQVLQAGLRAADPIPVLIVNEPIYHDDGGSDDLHYNGSYPRWAYDAYREIMEQASQEGAWDYLDLWDALPAGVFIDRTVHYDLVGAELLARRIAEAFIDGLAP